MTWSNFPKKFSTREGVLSHHIMDCIGQAGGTLGQPKLPHRLLLSYGQSSSSSATLLNSKYLAAVVAV